MYLYYKAINIKNIYWLANYLCTVTMFRLVNSPHNRLIEGSDWLVIGIVAAREETV